MIIRFEARSACFLYYLSNVLVTTFTRSHPPIAHPTELGLDLVRVAWRFRSRDWYKRFPFLPVPDRLTSDGGCTPLTVTTMRCRPQRTSSDTRAGRRTNHDRSTDPAKSLARADQGAGIWTRIRPRRNHVAGSRRNRRRIRGHGSRTDTQARWNTCRAGPRSAATPVSRFPA